MKFLNIQQQLAAQAPETPLLIVAGAGTGKTTTLTSRIAYLITKGVPSDEIVALTFTNKAAKEMADRLQGIVNIPKAKMPFLGTFHSFGARTLRSEAKYAGRKPNYAIFDDQDSNQLIKKIIKDLGIKNRDLGPAFFLRHISAIKNGVVSSAELEASPNPNEQLAYKIFERYERALLENNAFDFDDLIGKVAHVWRTNPERLQKYRKKFSHVLVDEYQDINPAQYELVRLLVGNSPNVSVVGDDQQMIYGWRYASLDTFLGFEKDWPNAQVVLLEENYRSTSNIIQAAGHVISKNEKQKTKTLWTKNSAGSLVKVLEAGDEDSEADWIAEQAEKILSQGDASPGRVGVLYRTNAQSRPIEQMLLERNISYYIFGGLKFYERREVKDVLAALRWVSNPEDSVSRGRLEKAFTKGVFLKIKTTLEGSAGLSPTEVIQRFLEAAEYFRYLDKHFLNSGERRENITELMRFSTHFTELGPLLEQVSLLQQTDVPENEKQKHSAPVHLMTVHLAKGLEFDHVFVAGVAEGLLPHARSLAGINEIEEERRLMYVAMTRARKELSLCYYDLPSRFLFEIPTELTEFESLISEETSLDDNEEKYITLD